MFLITRLAETNQTPFNFAEGESDFVSGFNIEYGKVGFALIFIAEYARIYFISTIFILVFLVVIKLPGPDRDKLGQRVTGLFC